jgi:uncharacterized protein YbjQ (UPF0145 family)
MMTTTLPEVPGNRPFVVLGVVGGIGSSGHPNMPRAWEDARHQLESQAEAMGADAVIDIRVQVVPVVSPPTPGVVVTLAGTAIKF